MQMVRQLFRAQLPGYVPRSQSSSSSGESFSSTGHHSPPQKIAEASWWSRFKVWCTPTWNEIHAQSAIPDRVPSLTKYQAHPYSHLEKGQGSTASKSSDETGSPRPTASSRLFRSVAKVAVPGLVFADEPVAAPPATSEKESYVFGNYASNVASRPADCRGTLCDSWIYCGCPYQYSCKHTRHICPPRALPVFAPRVPQSALLEATQTESTEKKQNLLCKHIEWSHATK